MAKKPFRKTMKEPAVGRLSPRLDSIHDYCLAKPGTDEGFPFGPEVMVIKVGGKIFAFLAWEKNPLTISLKCDPDRALELRDKYEAITGGYHLNKKHWNSVVLDETISPELIQELVDHSYELVLGSLKKKDREGIERS